MLDPRIGKLNSGQYYAYPDERYDLEPVTGTLGEVEAALGLPASNTEEEVKTAIVKAASVPTYTVTLRFQSPAWDEVDGIPYPGIEASSKSEAIKYARLLAEKYGHLMTGKGRYWFTAEKEDSAG